jgi:hypothetical protein
MFILNITHQIKAYSYTDLKTEVQKSEPGLHWGQKHAFSECEISSLI